MENRKIVFTKPNTAELLETEYREPNPDEVTVELEYSAISLGTEKASITGVRVGNFKEGEPAFFPRYSGYSAAGIVRQTGENATGLLIGDRVVVFWGSHQKYVTINKSNVIKIPDGVSSKGAALAFIGTFPLAAIRKTRLEIGEAAMVMGLGILGQLAVAELKAAGAVPVIAVDPVSKRREMAMKTGADFALDPTEENFCENVKEITDGGVPVVIEVTGLGKGMVQALDCMKKFGRIALLGCTRSSDFTIDYYTKVHMPGITVVGAHTMARPAVSSPGYWTEADDTKAILSLMNVGHLDFEKAICEIHSPVEAPKVYMRLIHDKDFPVGVLFDWKAIKI